MVHVTDLQLTRRGAAFYTKVSIDGQDADMLLDTGAEPNLLTDAAIHRLGLQATYPRLGRAVGVGGSTELRTVHSQDVRIGTARGQNLTFASVAGAADTGGGDGILGMDFLHDFDLDLDVRSNRIGLYKPLSGCHAPRTAMAGSLYAVQMAVGRSGDANRPALLTTVFVTINGVRLRALIDTGANRSAIFRDSAARADLNKATPIASMKVAGIGEHRVNAAVQIIAPVEIGELTVANMPILILDQPHPYNMDMLLGYDFVTRVHVWISRSSNSVILQYPPAATPLTDTTARD